MKFFNTLGRRLEEFKPLKDGEAGMYTCGPTVYNFAHIGNFRAYIFEDLLRRALKYHGYKVTQVMNLTDVDDKTIRDSKAAALPLGEFTAKYKKAFFEDLKTLRIEPAEQYPEATTHIQEMIEMIKALLEKGFAYKSDDGSVYFSIAKFPDYGKLAKIDMANQRAGARVRNDEYAKDSVADFALWKAWDESDGDVKWESPWGQGRPGWHLECSAMSMKYLGKTFDIHTGGIDNMFPHHEDEIAQSEAANSCRFVNYWLHCEHLIVDGQKMSKSLGNFYTLRDLLAKGHTGPELRWVLLGTHYRSKLNFNMDSLKQARTALAKFKDFFGRLKAIKGPAANPADVNATLRKHQEDFRSAIGNDLNVSGAIAVLFDLERDLNKAIAAGSVGEAEAMKALDQYRDFDKVLAVLDVDAAQDAADDAPAEILELARKRVEAKKAKDFKAADALRDQIKASGFVVVDTPKGPELKKA